jgi:hypothetical protein
MSSNEQDPHDHVPFESLGAFRTSRQELEEQRNQRICDDSEIDPEEEEGDYPGPDQDDDNEFRQDDQEEEDREEGLEELQRQNNAAAPSDDCDRKSSSEETKVNHSCQDDSNHDSKAGAQHQ